MRVLIALVFAAAAIAGTEPKAKPEDYPVHGQHGEIAIGAEYMVHSFSGGEAMYIAENFLVVEVALYPAKDKTVQANAGEFALRINGKRQTVAPQPASMVGASLDHPEWKQGRNVEADAGYGNLGVILGGPPRNDRPFPTAPPVSRLPQPPRAPAPEDNTGVEKAPKVKPAELAVQTALPEDLHHGPVSGFVYFPYSGKIGAIKSLDLLYEDTVLKLK